MEALKYQEPTAIPDPRIQFAMEQSVMTQYLAELQAYHIQWQMQPKFSIDHTQIATIANMKKDELTEYISDNSIDPTHYGYETFPTTVEEIRAAVIVSCTSLIYSPVVYFLNTFTFTHSRLVIITHIKYYIIY